MLQLIGGIIALVLALALIGFLFRLALGLIGIALVVALTILCGVQGVIALAFERIFRLLRLRLFFAVLLFAGCAAMFASLLAGLHPAVAPIGWASLKYSLPLLLLGLSLLHHRKRVGAQNLSVAIEFFSIADRDFFRLFFASCLIFATACASEGVNAWSDWLLSTVYWVICVGAVGYLLQQEVNCRKLLEAVHQKMLSAQTLNSTAYLGELLKSDDLSAKKTEPLYHGVLMLMLEQQHVQELELGDSVWLFNRAWYEAQCTKLYAAVESQPRMEEQHFIALIKALLNLSDENSSDYAERHFAHGERYEFSEQNYYIHYKHAHLYHKCTACGVADEKPQEEDSQHSDWYCSDLCRQTESACEEIRETEYGKFLADATTSGLIIMEGASAWRDNHKIFAANGQGHGFAAERANHRLDTLSGKNAILAGDNNAKDGADRIVGGQHIQTKYCSTAQRSVNAAFNGDEGQYRYVDPNGQPMQLEVPKDQYDKAVETMANKIKAGKVDGVSDPAEASKLVRKGHLTYEQARNITKFGTVESLTYDLAEGTIVGLTAGGISFGITACLFYLQTGDREIALRVAVVQGGKTFGKSLAVYVGTQQLHRLESVQLLLKVVDAEKLSPGVRQFLEQGFGVSRNGVSNALRGTIVTSVVLIAVTTGPDLIKLIRGSISKAQFLKNVAVASSSVAGGIAGSLIGAAAGSPFGPAGMWVGRFVGGAIGGAVAGTITNHITGKLMEDDRQRMLRIIRSQTEYLARNFVLTELEMNNLSANLDQAVTPKSLEVLHAAPNRRAMANAIIKPLVVGVVKQRPAFDYDAEHIVDACEKLAA
ncbi:hypothetical protein [Herbaspirillum sp. SJZ107]|uniref:hypothetical protein n=1 Tax=Herbaspirillum sp. SJZ107 TaxID=2572881 RepID=UPI001153A296|nr:hypothetical protein [Herbaspirillum sp. SJZ107]TQK04952.1 hypothetical protein FBX97_3914 [Herbaspirillum sp. SJZ107]